MLDVIVIGGGPAGVTAALRCRELGASVALVERDELGGTCTNDGCVPTRVLAKAARLLRDSESFASYGLSGARPELDFQRLLTQTQAIVYRIHEKKQLVGHLHEAGVQVYSSVGNASFVDANRIEFGGGPRATLEARKFILCVGGHARQLNFPGAELTMTHSDVWGLKALPASAVLVGGAATGCQFASILEAFGAKVTILDVSPRILPGEDEAVSGVMDRAFGERGIDVVTNIVGLDRVERTERGLRVIYRIGDETRHVEAEAVILAVGWPGNIESLNLDVTGVKTERGYIVADDFLRTSAPHIYAAGDITGRMMLVQSAGSDARVAAENAVLGDQTAYNHRIVPHGGFTDPEYGSVGLTEAKAREAHTIGVATIAYADTDRAVIDSRADGLCKLIVSAATHEILGAHVVGEQALEVTQLVAAGMASGMTVEALAELELAYPTYAAIVGLAARRIVTEWGLKPVAPHWRSIGRHLTVEWERRDR